MARTATIDVRRCLEQLLAHMELGSRNRVQARLGRGQRLDMVKLSNVAASGAAAHPNKPRTPICSSSRARLRSDAAVALSVEQRQRLRSLFIRYCAWCDRTNFMFMAHSQFLRFARDAGLTSNRVDSAALTLLYEKVVAAMEDSVSGNRLSLQAFVHAVTLLASRVYGYMSPADALKKVVTDHIIPLDDCLPSLEESDRLAHAMLSTDMITGLAAAEDKLRPVFEHYVQSQEIPGEPPGSEQGHGQQRTWDDLLEAKSKMPLAAFMRFASDFELVPSLVSKVEATQAFKYAKFKADKAAATITERLSFQEFCDSVGRCALLAYGYAEPPPPAVNTLAFTDSYHTAAKALWAREAAAAAAAAEEELDLPAASALPGRGDDKADATSRAVPDDLISRAVSRAVSVIQGRTRTRVPGGPEVMAVHCEPSEIENDKPSHLSTFSVEWVSKPGAPLNSRGTIRMAGTLKASEKLELAYEQRGQEMLVARQEREQHLAALKLQYEAERRKEQLERRQQRVGQRHMLETIAGQMRGEGSHGGSIKPGASSTLLEELLAPSPMLDNSV